MLSLARQLTSKSTRFAVVARALSTSAVADVPSVKDKIVSLTFVDPSGARRKVPAMVGTYCTGLQCFETDRIIIVHSYSSILLSVSLRRHHLGRRRDSQN